MPLDHEYTLIEPDAEGDDLPAPAIETALSETDDSTLPTRDDDDDTKFVSTFFRTRTAVHILFFIFMLSLGFGNMHTIVPGLLEDRFARLEFGYDGPPCADFHKESTAEDNRPQECKDGGDAAQNAAAASAFAANMLMLVFSPVVGSLSDCHGRRAFLVATSALLATTPLSLLLIQISDRASPYWYYFSRAIQGLVYSSSICFTVLADVMPPKMRSPSNGLFLATYLFGNGMSQILAKVLSHLMVTIVASILVLSGCIFIIMVFRESLPEEARRKALSNRREEENNWGRVILRPIRELSILNRNKFFRLLAVVSVCSGMTHSSDSTLIVYYMKNQLDIGYQSIATMFFFKSLVGVLVNVFLVKLAIGCLREKRAVTLGLMLGTIHNLFWGLASTQWGIFAGMVASEFAGIHFPILVGMRSANVGEEEQGRVQGAFFALEAIADAVGPVLLQGIYDQTENTVRPGPGFMFVVAALIYVFGAIAACMLPADKANVTSRTRGENTETDICRESLPAIS
eukprot:CAMPEP_0201639102 /NCGR_PEP_ID=MMETSP0493-20130528/18399_1 /ASSEMBLY_ACC=CAM_ASM_000838 /TAXON_ID=420259 /ORGANISM="Thalassiosira gravida, Strain GMp14c1" /LENGTH=514 /DNA_ID=CAMNT_0048112387 /DNA_START=23 /DNA_END=1567 /DNA_ORIENTATION=+